ncbi:MAG: hypothetical protein ACPLX8_00150 [Nanopusillaceae archaeon]
MSNYKISEDLFSTQVKPTDLNTKYTSKVYIPTILTKSIERTNLVTPLCRYNERVSALYALKTSSNKRKLFVGASLALLLATILYLYFDKKENSKPKSNTPKYLKESFDASEFTVVNIGNEGSLVMGSVIVDTFDSIEDIYDNSAETFKLAVKKLIPFGPLSTTIITPTIICFLEEYEHAKENKVKNFHDFNYVIVDSLMDRVVDLITVGGHNFISTASLEVVKRQSGYSDLSIDALDKMSKSYRTKGL